MPTKKIALFIDADNISSKLGKQILETLENRGEVFIRRIYGNWEKIPLRGWNDCILSLSLRAVQQPDFVTGKNATDMCLTIDAMDVLHSGQAEIFALVSNDSDFTPLAIRLREGGMHIIGLGNSNASNSFRAACNEFIDLDAPAEVKASKPKAKVEKKISAAPAKKSVVVPVKKSSVPPAKKSPVQLSLFGEEKVIELKPQPSAPQKVSAPVAKSPKVISISDRKLQSERDKKIQQIHNVLRETVTIHGDAQGFVSLCHAGKSVQESGFGVKDAGFGTLQAFIAAFPKLYELTQRGENGALFFRRRDAAPKISAEDPLEQIHDVLRETAKTHADAEGFVPLCWAGQNIRSLGFGIKNLGFGSLNKFIASFPSRYELIQRDSSENFCYRCREDEEQKKSAEDDNPAQLNRILRDTAELHAEADGFVNLWWACDTIISKKNLDPAIKSLSYNQLRDYVSALPDLYAVIRRDATNECFYRCRSVEAKNFSAEDRLNQLHEILHEAADAHCDEEGFSLLNYAGQELKSRKLGFGIKDFGYHQLREFVADFPDLYETSNDAAGQKFRYRCRAR